MDRPHKTDELICRVAAEEWVESRLDQLLGDDYFATSHGQESFTNGLVEGMKRGPYDAHSLARYARISTSDEVIDDLEDFMAYHENVYVRTVKQWRQGWHPKRPFDGEYGRITVRRRGNELRSGIAKIDKALDDVAQLHLYPDTNKDDVKIMKNPYGVFGSANVLDWEDVVEATDLSPEDLQLISDHKAKVTQFELETAANRAYNAAKQQISSDIKKHSNLEIEAANAIFDDLKINEADIPLIISALQKVGIQRRIAGNSNVAVMATTLI